VGNAHSELYNADRTWRKSSLPSAATLKISTSVQNLENAIPYSMLEANVSVMVAECRVQA
jgi:hypothetical protein